MVIASRKHAATMANIPVDVLWNIFNRLPAKQLARMRCISKLWNALLSQSSFVKSHLDHSIMNTDDEILLVYLNCELFTTHPSRSPTLQLPNLIKLPVNTPSQKSWDLIGSANGLICFSTYQEDNGHVIHIWNPSLSALTSIPPYPICEDDDDDDDDDDDNDVYHRNMLFRFGFDPKNGDYKVVKVAFCVNSLLNMINGTLQMDVYSIRKGRWESVVGFPTHITLICNKDEACVDGHLYWLCYVDIWWDRETIVAFDLGVESFREISLPHSLQGRSNVLGVLSQKLCVMSCTKDGDFEVWVMDTYGWMKHHVFPPFGGNIVPIGFTLNNVFLFIVGHRLALYDPNAAAVKLFKLMSGQLNFTKIVQYIDSLVWVEPTKCRSISSF